jgi:hypothetical protein
MTALTVQDQLRLFLGERVPTGGTAADTFFSDDEIQMLLDSQPYGVNGAAVMGWAAKAGEWARLIDMNESGGVRNLSQRYRQAMTQLNYFQGRVEQDIAVNTSAGRVVGRSVNWAGVCDSQPVVLWTERFNRLPELDNC